PLLLTMRAPPPPPSTTQIPVPLLPPRTVLPLRSMVRPAPGLACRTTRPSPLHSLVVTGSLVRVRLLTTMSPQAQGTSFPATSSPHVLAATGLPASASTDIAKTTTRRIGTCLLARIGNPQWPLESKPRRVPPPSRHVQLLAFLTRIGGGFQRNFAANRFS